jgi:hypothetical protein
MKQAQTYCGSWDANHGTEPGIKLAKPEHPIK